MFKSHSVLVIDDSEDDRLLYRRSLQKSVYGALSLREANDGELGIMMMENDMPDCVLLDYSLPGRNGIEVLKRIRARFPFVPVVMMTGQGNETLAVTAIQEKAQNYIPKSSITPETLERVIRDAIAHCALARQIGEQSASLEIFTHALAHDLKEPVRTIRSFLELVSAQHDLPERARDYFTYIHKAAERMAALIDTVYLYTRIDGAEQAPNDICDSNDVLQAVKENIHRLITERSAVITSATLPSVSANRVQLTQILQNLICNAINHSASAPEIHVSAEDDGTAWRFSVSDNGAGIAESDVEKLFQPFKRLKRDSAGLGLGLAICRKIAEAHHGKIWHEKRDGKGATFCFTLPKAEADAQTPKVTAPERLETPKSDAITGPARLLLVDDNDADIRLAQIFLLEAAQMECSLHIARDGYEALACLHDTPIDLILLDINMPGLDGFEILERMKTGNLNNKTPVIMCTTSAYDRDMQRAEAMGAAGYMTKPPDFATLKRIIEKNTQLRLQPHKKGYMLQSVA